MDFLQRNPCKLANYLYKIENFLVLLRIQLNFYIIGRKSAEEEKENEWKWMKMQQNSSQARTISL